MNNERFLGDEAEKDAQMFLDDFKSRMSKLCDEILGEAYIKLCDEILGEAYINCMPWIEADSWLNMRNQVMDWLGDYKKLDHYDAKRVREIIFKKYREDIIKDLDQDNLKRIKELEELVEHERQIRRDFYYRMT